MREGASVCFEEEDETGGGFIYEHGRKSEKTLGSEVGDGSCESRGCLICSFRNFLQLFIFIFIRNE
jgi:hypothetical protein